MSSSAYSTFIFLRPSLRWGTEDAEIKDTLLRVGSDERVSVDRPRVQTTAVHASATYSVLVSVSFLMALSTVFLQ